VKERERKKESKSVVVDTRGEDNLRALKQIPLLFFSSV